VLGLCAGCHEIVDSNVLDPCRAVAPAGQHCKCRAPTYLPCLPLAAELVDYVEADSSNDSTTCTCSVGLASLPQAVGGRCRIRWGGSVHPNDGGQGIERVRKTNTRDKDDVTGVLPDTRACFAGTVSRKAGVPWTRCVRLGLGLVRHHNHNHSLQLPCLSSNSALLSLSFLTLISQTDQAVFPPGKLCSSRFALTGTFVFSTITSV
jgi:hypothetical protein